MFFRYEGERKKAIDLDNIFAGESCILVGSAPSLKEQIHLLQDPRLTTMAMNNAASMFTPTLWIGADPAQNYSNAIFSVPSIMKFNYCNLSKPDRHTSRVGGTGPRLLDLPNMYFIEGRANVKAEEYFAKGRQFVWWKNVFMVALQTLYRLGFKTVYLAGCSMKISNSEQYAYDCKLDAEKVQYNQSVYRRQIHDLSRVLDVRRRQGVKFDVISCTPDSALNEIIPFIDLQDVTTRTLAAIPEHNTAAVLHPIDNKRERDAAERRVPPANETPAEFACENMPPIIGRHYCMGLEHRKTILRALPPNGKMLEWGSGASTVWFRANMKPGQQLFSVEHDKGYARKTGAKFIEFNPGKPASPGSEELNENWEEYVEVWRWLNDSLGAFDVILVDGVLRNKCLQAVPKLLKPTGRVFLHDAERDWYEEGKQALRWIKDHGGAADYRNTKLIEGDLG